MASPFNDKDYQAEDDHRTLMRAEEIKEDKGRVAGVKRHHRKETRKLQGLGKALHGRR